MRFDAGQKFKITEDSNGFITAEGVIASAGEKLIYKDGVETIAESALFSNMDDWEGLPLTMTHPKTLLNPQTVQKHQVGSVIKAWRKDNQLWAKFKVTSLNALSAVRKGLRGLSAGYNVQLDSNRNQVHRLNNHLALVEAGRSPSSGIRSDERRDSFDLTQPQESKTMYVIKFPQGTEVKLDCTEAESQLLQGGIDAMQSKFDAESSEEKDKLDEMKAKIEGMKKDGESTEKLQATYDALFEKMEKSKEEAKGKMDSDDLAIIFDTHEKAQQLNSAIKIRKDSGAIKTARELVEEALPEVKFDGKSDDYAFARLDSTIEFSSSDNVKKQRGDCQDNNVKTTLTVQQRSDAKFYNTEAGEK